MRRAGGLVGHWRPSRAIGGRNHRSDRKGPRAIARAQLLSHNGILSFPDDARRPVSAAKNIRSFYAGLDTLGVAYQQIIAPYGEGHRLGPSTTLPPKVVRRPLIILGGGYDSTLEEDAREHGYAVLTYDGPGQGSVLRDQGLTFAHAWEKPTTAVVDAFLAGHSRPRYMVLVGMSMGG